MIAAEQWLYDDLTAHGSTVLRVGWPDFLVCFANRTVAIEVKSPTDKVRPAQLHMAYALEAAGLPVFRVDIDPKRGYIGKARLFQDYFDLSDDYFTHG